MTNIKLPNGAYSFGNYNITISNNGNKLILLAPYYRSNIPWDETLLGYVLNGVLMFTFTNSHATIYGEGSSVVEDLSPPIETVSGTVSGDPFITPIF